MSQSPSTYSIRIFPKEEKVCNDKALGLCKELINNSRFLDNQLQYNIDLDLNFIDVRIGATTFNLYENIDTNRYDIWHIGAYSGSYDWIREINEPIDLSEKTLYAFDQIEFIGKQNTLMDFYKKVYDFRFKDYSDPIFKAFNKPKENSVKLKVKGMYNACNFCYVGELDTREPQRKVEFDLFKESVSFDKQGIGNIIFECSGFTLLEAFIHKIGIEGFTISKTNDLQKVIFYHENKVMRSYEWIDDSPGKVYEHRYGYWKTQNADEAFPENRTI